MGRRLFGLVGAALFAVAGALAGPAAAGYAASAGNYLALGDSVSFGYEEPTVTPPPNYSDASTLVGYPELVGPALGLKVANAACPGETSLSLIEAHVQSNGCENSPGGGPGYRDAFPLHVTYGGTQIQFALRYLRAHPDTKLVTLMIGANDGFLCEETTADHCASELPAVLKQIRSNINVILTVVRQQAGYTGKIVIVDYYSLDYNNALDNAQSLALNGTMNRAAHAFGVTVADGFAAFQAASAHSGGNPCTAGLLTQLSTGGCGIHPSLAGQAVLAQAVEAAYQS